jgi:Flp pilus assembly protein TadD
LVQFGGQAMADRFTYIPHIGLFLLVTWTVGDLLSGRRAGQAVGAIASFTVLGLLAAVTSWQLRYWQDSVTLFTRALEVTSDNFMAHNNLGVALAARGEPEAAAQHYAEAVRINPTWPEANNNLGMAYAVRGDYVRARWYFEQALRVRPRFAVAENNLATAFAFDGNFEAAVEHYTRAVQLTPDYFDARYALADALERTGRLQQAVQEYRRVVEMRPGWPPAQQRLQRAAAALEERAAATRPPGQQP